MSAATGPQPVVRLVLVHGSRLSHTQWDPQVRLLASDPSLAERLEVVTPDLPGHGARATEPFTLDAAIDVIDAAVESVIAMSPSGRPAPSRVVLAGHSLGGYAAMAYAEVHPRRLDGLVLLSCAAVPRGVGAAAYRSVASLADRLGEVRMTTLDNRLLRRFYPPDVVEPIIAGGYYFAPTAAAWREVMARCGPWMLREVSCPVLVAGGRYDQLMIHARRYAREAPQGRVVVIPRAGHFVGLDQPERVTRLLADFALSVPDGRLLA